VASVVLQEDFEEMCDVVLFDVLLYPKVIDDQDKTDRAPIMGLISWCQLTLAVPSDVEALF
jgi:hypothetical protein